MIGEFAWNHREDAISHVGRVATGTGFFVQSGTWFDVVGDVRDVNGKLPATIFHFLDANGIVKVLGIMGVDGDDRELPPVVPTLNIPLRDAVAKGFSFIQDIVGKFGAES